MKRPPKQRPAPRSEDHRDFVTALKRGLEILRSFEQGERLLGNAELAQRTGLPKSTVSRLTGTLSALGYLSADSRLDKYQLGTGVLSLGYAFLSSLEVARLGVSPMRELADYGKVNVGLAAPDHLDMVYVEAAIGSGNTFFQLSPGLRIPIESTAAGFAFLSTLSPRDQKALLDHIRTARPQRFPKAVADLNKATAELAERGFCIAEWQPDIIAAASPLLEADGSCRFVFNCGGPKYMLTRKRLESELGPRLVNMVHNIRRHLPHGSR
jgi:DNA-binding IclR family transcriptional regulator